ncbi:MAG: patatin-like phospholipase family protein [Bacilli bacterium]
MKIGLALAGGGASGGAHVGVIRALEEAGIEISVIGGTSSGAMVAGLYAAGVSTSQMLTLLPALTRKQIDVDFSQFPRLLRRQYTGGLLRGERLHKFIRDAVSDRNMTEAKIPLAIVATDLQTGREVIFASHPCPSPVIHILADDRQLPLWHVVQHAPLATAIRASISIPLVFQPLHWEDMILADGGLVDNCPVGPVRALGADFVIGVDTITPFLRLRGKLPLRVRSLLQQIVNIGLARHAALSALGADVFLAPEVGPIGALDFPRLASVAERGYEYTKQRIDSLAHALHAHSTS